MKSTTNHYDKVTDLMPFAEAKAKYSIRIRDDIKESLTTNSEGYPVRDLVKVDDEEHEIGAFLSPGCVNKNYCIGEPLTSFLDSTKRGVVPIGLDSEDNYYCVSNGIGKIYHWSANDNQYYRIGESVAGFTKYLEQNYFRRYIAKCKKMRGEAPCPIFRFLPVSRQEQTTCPAGRGNILR